METILFIVISLLASALVYFFLKKNQHAVTISDLQRENEMLEVRLEELDNLKDEKKSLDIKYQSLENKLSDIEKINVGLKKDLDQTRNTKDEAVIKFAEHTDRLMIEEQKRQQKVIDDKESELSEKKMQWKQHEDDVQNHIQLICKKNIIDYVSQEDFPYPRNKPDCSIKILDQLIVFDAKSPLGDDTSKFNTYLKDQATNLKKYAKHSDVRKELFLVIPTNTTHSIKEFRIDCGDYMVFIVTKDSLEPIILSLKKIEDYEFADKLSPEERDNICRVIGTFAHAAKRRIQIDQWYNQIVISDMQKAGRILPKEFVKLVQQYDTAEKLNPPQEKRNKKIELSELKENSDDFKKEMNTKFEILDKNIPQIDPQIIEKTNNSENIEN